MSAWMNWTPKGEISKSPSGSEPTKPSKPTSVGFVGATPGEFSEMELARASDVLGRAGVRLMQLDGVATVGVWSDLDGPELRAALRVFGADALLVRYLDGAAIPARYKLRRVDGEPVPMSVLAERELSRKGISE